MLRAAACRSSPTSTFWFRSPGVAVPLIPALFDSCWLHIIRPRKTAARLSRRVSSNCPRLPHRRARHGRRSSAFRPIARSRQRSVEEMRIPSPRAARNGLRRPTRHCASFTAGRCEAAPRRRESRTDRRAQSSSLACWFVRSPPWADHGRPFRRSSPQPYPTCKVISLL